MIKTDNVTIEGKMFVRTYSDSGMMIHGGSPEGDYVEALDPAELGRTYMETEIPIEGDEADAQEILDIILGGEDE